MKEGIRRRERAHKNMECPGTNVLPQKKLTRDYDPGKRSVWEAQKNYGPYPKKGVWGKV